MNNLILRIKHNIKHSRYGEEAPSPKASNLLGQLWEQYDKAGKLNMTGYDFKGNLLHKTRQVIDDTTLKNDLNNYDAFLVDWTGLPAILDPTLYTTDNAYDALNRVTKLTLPENVNAQRKDIVPAYNRAGALEQVSYDGTTYVRHIAYNAKGQRLFIAFGNDMMTRYTYDNDTFRLLRQRSEKYTKTQQGSTITYAYQNATKKQDDGYGYDLIGNILEINKRTTGCGVGGTDSLDRTFEYDPLYRLKSASGRENVPGGSYPFPGWQDTTRSTDPNSTEAYTRKYKYDKVGNIQELRQIGNNSFTRTFSYTDNKLDSIDIGSDSYTFTYNASGNQLTENTDRQYEWDAGNQLLTFRNQVGTNEPTVLAQYLYDGEGNRVKKIVRKQGGNYEIRVYIDDIFEYFTDETEEQNTVHIMDDKSRIATVRIGVAMGDSTPAIKYVLENNINSSMVMLDTNGAVVNEQEYYPFGETSFGSYGKKRYQYTGKERDEESGLYYYGARYYSAWTCRFISVDPLAADYPHLTPYSYAGNKPITHKDVDGLQGTGNEPKGKVINVHKEEMEEAKAEMKKKKAKVDNIKSNKPSKEDFENRKEYRKARKEYKDQLSEAKSEYKAARSTYGSAKGKYEEVEDLLNEYAYYHPEGYEELKSYVDYEGNPIDVHVRINTDLEIKQDTKSLPHGEFGNVNIESVFMDPKTKEFAYVTSEEGKNTIIIELAPNNWATTIAHEKGHFEFRYFENPADVEFKKSTGGKVPKGRHGTIKGIEDPSGERAIEETERYRKSKKQVIKNKGFFDKYKHKRK